MPQADLAIVRRVTTGRASPGMDFLPRVMDAGMAEGDPMPFSAAAPAPRQWSRSDRARMQREPAG